MKFKASLASRTAIDGAASKAVMWWCCAALILFCTGSVEAQVVSCTEVTGLSASVSSGAAVFNTSGSVTLDYRWTNTSGVASVSGSVPGNAVVTSVSVSISGTGIQLSTACLQHGTSGWPVDFLADYAGLAAFNGTSVTGSGPWIVRPVVTVLPSNPVLEVLVRIDWKTPAPSPPPQLSMNCTDPSGLEVHHSVSFSCSASGGTAPFHWFVYGFLPAGLTFQESGNNASLSGTVSASGNYNFTFGVYDSSSQAQKVMRVFSGWIPPSGIGSYDLLSPDDESIAFDYDSSGKQDHLVMYRPGSGIVYILKNSGGQFSPVYASAGGIGSYDLKSTKDRIVPFDYDGSGKLDYLVMYRPGDGIVYILKNSGGNFSPVYASFSGIGGYDLRSDNDMIFAFDYEGSGKQDYLALYRPGSGTIWILKNQGGRFSPVYAMGSPGTGIGGYDLASVNDRVFAFDYDGSGKQDHLVLYRPGSGTIWILKNQGGRFSPVYAMGSPGTGIGGYDLASTNDRVFGFDYDGSGKQDHLTLYRPGSGTIWILKNSGGQFSPVYAEGSPGNGIGGYDLSSLADRVFAYDYNASGKQDHLALYRPGTGIFWILQNENGAFSPVYLPR